MAATLRELARTHSLGRVDQEDHQGPGDDRHVANLEGPGPSGSGSALLRPRSPTCSPTWPLSARWITRCSSRGSHPSGRPYWWSRRIADFAVPTTRTSSVVSEELFSLLRDEGKKPVIYAVGRKALSYYSFRDREVAESWTGFVRVAHLRAGSRDRRHARHGVHVRCRRRG